MIYLTTELSLSVVHVIIVLLVLSLISGAISLYLTISSQRKNNTSPIPPQEAPAPIITEVTTTSASTEANIIPLEVIAAITAAVALSLNTSPENFRINNVRKLSPWKIEARREQQARIY